MEAKELTLRQKLAVLRSHMAGLDLKKSGRNNHANFDYYELGDFLPDALKKMSELKMIGVTDFYSSDKFVFLDILDCEDENAQPIRFATEKAQVTIQGAQRMQNIGGEHTYHRRYLWMDALEISEPDTLDAISGKKKQDQGNTQGQNPESKWINKQDEQQILTLKSVGEIEAAVKKIYDEGKFIGKDRIIRIDARKKELESKTATPTATQTEPPKKNEDILYATLSQVNELLAITDPVLLKDKKDKLVEMGAHFTKIQGQQLIDHFTKISAASGTRPKDELDEILNSKKNDAEAMTQIDASEEQLSQLDKLL
jgi:hypothetical protein